MSNLTLLLSKMLGSRKGSAAPTYTLSGTINDSAGDGLDDVTVTLTGDASDSTTTAGGGAYSFTVPDGSYTVTPTKVGSTFSPASANVTISGADDTAATMAQVWAISGTIVDGAAAGIAGVTVALTGDATDSDTTDVNGAYSFTGLSDGSYTVTPTYTNLKMTPASRAANVSGANVSVDAIVGNYLLLPYTYSMSSVAPTSGAVYGQLDDWFAGTDGLSDSTISSTVQDSNSYTYPGVTKTFNVVYDAARDRIINLLPYEIDPSATSIRFAVLGFESNGNHFPFFSVSAALPINAQTSYLHLIYTGNPDPDQITTAAYYESGSSVAEFNSSNLAGNLDISRYLWIRVEWNFVSQKVYVSAYRTEDSSERFSVNANMNAAGITLGHVPSGMKYFQLSPSEGVTNSYIAKFWIGTGSDDWPT